jgi:hypothetical protein
VGITVAESAKAAAMRKLRRGREEVLVAMIKV